MNFFIRFFTLFLNWIKRVTRNNNNTAEVINLTEVQQQQQHQDSHHEVIDTAEENTNPPNPTQDDDEDKCIECLVEYDQPNRPLTEQKGDRLCIGCYRMLNMVGSNVQEAENLRNWLRTGNLPANVLHSDVDNVDGETRIKKRAVYMEKRLQTDPKLSGIIKNQYAKDLPSGEDLYQLYVDAEFRCAVTGWKCYVQRGQPQYWSIKFDHIVPISNPLPNMNPWAIGNIQVLSHVIDKVKGDGTNADVHEWYKGWMNAHP